MGEVTGYRTRCNYLSAKEDGLDQGSVRAEEKPQVSGKVSARENHPAFAVGEQKQDWWYRAWKSGERLVSRIRREVMMNSGLGTGEEGGESCRFGNYLWRCCPESQDWMRHEVKKVQEKDLVGKGTRRRSGEGPWGPEGAASVRHTEEAWICPALARVRQ